MSKPENPPAFPREHRHLGHNGMDLRDWFATHAPTPNDNTMVSARAMDRNRNPHNEAHKPRPRTDHEIRAELAYAYADAMLAERAKGGEA